MNQQLILPILVIILTVTFVVEFNIGYVADFIPDWLVSNEGMALFIGSTVVFAVGGVLLLRYLNNNVQNRRAPLHIGVTVAYYVLIAIVAFIVAQILVTEQYSTIEIAAIIVITYGLWIAILFLLSVKLVSWIRTTGKKKTNLVVLVLALSMIAYVVNGVTGLANHLFILQEQQKEVVTSADVALFPEFDPESLSSQVGLVHQIASYTGYVLTWIGTVMLLRPYIHRIGKIKFYAIMGAVMVYYLMGFPLLVLGYFTPTGQTDVEVMNNIIIYGFAAILSGIIFGAAFLSVARTLRKDSALRGYMMLAAYGFILFYVTGSASVAQLAYPPFGLASVAFTGLSTYLIYVGQYFAAVSVSQDYEIRNSIRKSAAKEIKFLEDMGMAHMQQERQDAVLLVAKKSAETLAEETGVKPSLDEGDMREYLEEVLKEIENITTKTKK